MTSTPLPHKDTIKFDGTEIDVTYHENPSGVVLDKVTYAGTDRTYSVDCSRQGELKDKLSGRF